MLVSLSGSTPCSFSLRCKAVISPSHHFCLLLFFAHCSSLLLSFPLHTHKTTGTGFACHHTAAAPRGTDWVVPQRCECRPCRPTMSKIDFQVRLGLGRAKTRRGEENEDERMEGQAERWYILKGDETQVGEGGPCCRAGGREGRAGEARCDYCALPCGKRRRARLLLFRLGVLQVANGLLCVCVNHGHMLESIYLVSQTSSCHFSASTSPNPAIPPLTTPSLPPSPPSLRSSTPQVKTPSTPPTNSTSTPPGPKAGNLPASATTHKNSASPSSPPPRPLPPPLPPSTPHLPPTSPASSSSRTNAKSPPKSSCLSGMGLRTTLLLLPVLVTSPSIATNVRISKPVN